MTTSEPAQVPSRPAGSSFAVSSAVLLLEVAAFGALGYVGWQLGGGIVKLLLVFAVPVAAIVWWGLFVAPKARVRLPAAARLVAELLVYAAAVVGLLVVGAYAAGVALGVLVVVYEALRPTLRRRGLLLA